MSQGNEVCAIEVVPDGLRFVPETLKLAEAQLEAEYHGISAAFSAQLFTAKLPMRIDFGFNDAILPHPAKVQYPTLLDFPAPELKGYTPQTSISVRLIKKLAFFLSIRVSPFIWKSILIPLFCLMLLEGITPKRVQARYNLT